MLELFFLPLRTQQRPPDAEEALKRNWRERSRNKQNDDKHIQTRFSSSAKLAEKESEKTRKKGKELRAIKTKVS